MSTATAKPALAPRELKMQDVIMLSARLAQLLAEEVDFLAEMKVDKIEALQPEKLFLINALEAQRKLAEKYPHLKEKITAQDKNDLLEVMKVFNPIVEENNRKLLLAKAVNHRVVQAITEVVKEGTMSKVYGMRGITGAAPFETLSVTLNKMV